jgi:hypothetical protein
LFLFASDEPAERCVANAVRHADAKAEYLFFTLGLSASQIVFLEICPSVAF